MNWYQKTAQEVQAEQNVKVEEGLSGEEATSRYKSFGPNVLAKAKKQTLFDVFLRQFKSPLIYILIFAALLVLLMGQSTDAVVIIVVIVSNAVIGTYQEGKAKNSLERLRNLVRHKALVRRGGQEVIISAEEVVPGDILILHEGDKVIADARLVVVEGLNVNESVLTGEAYSVSKILGVISKDNLVLGDQKNMVFSGTSIASGFAEAVVVETGYGSALGQISKELLATSDVPLPLAAKVLKLTHFIALATLVIAVFTLLVGLARGIELVEIVGAVIGLSVSIVPEGLPVAVTIVLAGGVWRMARAKAIVRQMAAVEAMGNADTLLVDKTGTITTGKMVIRRINFMGDFLQVTGNGYDPEGRIVFGDKGIKEDRLRKILSLVYLSLKAEVILEEHGGWKPTGDSTEAAIAALCQKAGLSKEKLEGEYKTAFANPFDAKKRYIEASFSKDKEKWHTFVGAPEFLSRDLKIDHDLTKDYHELASEGLRVVGVAVFGPHGHKFYGWLLLAIEEEIRGKVRESVLEAREAGFRVVMMTGDYAETAKAIATRVGIFDESHTVLTGEEVERLQEAELLEKIETTSVFARITPQHKLKIVNAFKKAGHIVAMTGDGVNDAPALQAANLGIGLGSGTQVAKDASDIVLVSDNFQTIVAAIAEGRSIYLSLKKVILYLFSTSLGEVLAIVGAVVIGLPLPLLAVQIIWLNFVTDGFMVVALAQDMPRHKLVSKTDVGSDNLVDSLMIRRSLLMGGAMVIVTMPLFWWFLNNNSLVYARTMALLILSATQWFNVLNVRSRYLSVFSRRLDNVFLVFSFSIVIVLEVLVIQTKFGNKFLHTVPLSFDHWILAILVSTLIIWVEEMRKFLSRRKWVV